jgi:putative endonuclease
MPFSDESSVGRENRVKKGREYEKLAASYFKKQGFEILESNWRVGSKEIDLIAKQDGLIVFVEVKSATTKKFGHPAERVDKKKISHLTNAAQQYLIAKKIDGVDLRFDVITFTDGTLEHYPNAFEAEE